jgi:hypothetical protein
VSRVSMKKAGFITISPSGPYGDPEGMVAFSQFFPAGEYINVPITLNDFYKTKESLSLLEPGMQFFVGIYYDDGDEQFNPDSDTIARNSFGDPILSHAKIL